MAIVVLVLSFLIGVGYLIIIRSYDRYEKDSLFKLIIAFVVGGIVSVVITTLMYSQVRVEETFWDAVLKIGTIEELSKMAGFMVVLLLFRKSINEIVDGLIFISAVALGFACIENVLYALGSDEPIILLFKRSVYAVAGHMSFAGYMGIALFIHFKRRRNITGVILSFVLAALAHGLYDGVLFERSFNELFHYLFIAIVIGHLFLYKIVLSFSRFKPVIDANLFTDENGLDRHFCIKCEREREIRPVRFKKIHAAHCNTCKSYIFDSRSWIELVKFFRPLVNSKKYGRFLKSEFGNQGVISLDAGGEILYDSEKEIISADKDSLRVWVNHHNRIDQKRILNIPLIGILLKYIGLRHLYRE